MKEKKIQMCQMYKREEGVNPEVAGVRFRFFFGRFVFTIIHRFCFVFFVFFFSRLVRIYTAEEHTRHVSMCFTIAAGGGVCVCERANMHVHDTCTTLARRFHLQTTTQNETDTQKNPQATGSRSTRQTHTGQSTSVRPPPSPLCLRLPSPIRSLNPTPSSSLY